MPCRGVIAAAHQNGSKRSGQCIEKGCVRPYTQADSAGHGKCMSAGLAVVGGRTPGVPHNAGGPRRAPGPSWPVMARRAG